MRKLLIADCNEEFRLTLAEALQTDYHVFCCGSGKEALALLRSEHPDSFVLDLMLPELDGITLLETAVSEGICPKVLAATPLLTDYVLEAAERLGIGYLMRKPCDIRAAAARVRDLNRPLNSPIRKPDPRSLISEHLLALSISTKHNGFGYLIEATMRMLEDPTQSVTKELYPDVAKECGCKTGHVERSIRSALESAWEHRVPAVWQQYFPEALRRPTNAAFLSRLVEAIRLELE